jgi:eukaryotic-like serine/threonine-protein kinase
MDSQTHEVNDREERVNVAIYDYHVAVERGESADPDAWVAQNPEIADELTAYFEDLKGLNLLRPPPRRAPQVEWTVVGGFDFKPGDSLGDYILLEKLGEGGQGVVWKASPKLQREIFVALKTLPGPVSNDPAAIERLREDVDAIAMMKHPNIIRTVFFGEYCGRWFFVMELMEGGTIADRIESYKANPRSAAVLIEKVARAIHHAHTRSPGVSHLDLKPGNILLNSEGEPKVTDFGMSVRFRTLVSPEGETATLRSADEDVAEDVAATISRLGIRGTIPYMSPEMAAGRWSSDVSTAADIYGLGAILYAMLTGRAPFNGETRDETLSLVINGGVTSPREFNRRVDRELNAVCLKCLEREPNRRYGSADALANDLCRWLDGRPTLAGGKPSAAREIRFWMGRNPRGVTLAAVACGALWLARLAGSLGELRVENARAAERLARQVDRELSLVRRATLILANDPRLRAAFASFQGQDRAQAHRRVAIEQFLKTAVESENLFKIVGVNPLVNVFVLNPDAILVADTLPASPAVGKSYSVRDYYRGFFEKDRNRDYVYVARSFKSEKDDRYKIAVSTRIWDDKRNLLGYLVANFTIGPRLIDVDLRQEPSAATVLCPMDRSDPRTPRPEPAENWQYISVLDRQYTMDWKDEPIQVGASRVSDFKKNPGLFHAARGPEGGKLVDYQRVGESHMVVVARRTCPWPLSWLPNFR